MAAPPAPPASTKAILGIGLRSNSEFPESVVMENLAQQTALAKEAGFNVDTYFVEPQDASKTLHVIREAIRSRPQWDGVMIGFGVRGDPAHTSLFELAVNTCIEEIKPAPRFAFNVSPDSTVEALMRVFT